MIRPNAKTISEETGARSQYIEHEEITNDFQFLEVGRF
jgi:hypothetical protein